MDFATRSGVSASPSRLGLRHADEDFAVEFLVVSDAAEIDSEAMGAPMSIQPF